MADSSKAPGRKASVADAHSRTLEIYARTKTDLQEADRRLNIASLAVLAFVHGGLVPTKIELLGIEISNFNRRAILMLAAVVCLHLTITCFYLAQSCHRQLLDARVSESKLVAEEEKATGEILVKDRPSKLFDFAEWLMKFVRYWWPVLFGLFAFEEAMTDGGLVHVLGKFVSI